MKASENDYIERTISWTFPETILLAAIFIRDEYVKLLFFSLLPSEGYIEKKQTQHCVRIKSRVKVSRFKSRLRETFLGQDSMGSPVLSGGIFWMIDMSYFVQSNMTGTSHVAVGSTKNMESAAEKLIFKSSLIVINLNKPNVATTFVVAIWCLVA